MDERAEIAERLRQLYRAAGSPDLTALATRAGVMDARGRAAGKRISDWMSPRGHMPKDWERLRRVVGTLCAIVVKGSGFTPVTRHLADEDAWRRLYERARTPGAPAPDVPVPDVANSSPYLDEVRRIAPPELLERDAEMSRMFAFCDADERYLWWRGEPRAGKSAVMSWFVLHPPPGVWVVSFFVSSRQASRSTSSDFARVVLAQLSAILGEEVPVILGVEERSHLCESLLSLAAEHAGRAGVKLVLVVDGLDEDAGVRPGSGLPSIASLLPSRPGDHLRVVISSRLNPPIPHDVPPAHPLRRCEPLHLIPSAHGRDVMALADRELDELLAIDPQRHDGLGRQVLSLVAASGGGLTGADLENLVNAESPMRPRYHYEFDVLWQGLFGRTVAGRDTGGQRVYAFTHETLQLRALDRLGAHALAAARGCIHRWADGYRERGWPADTPQYLWSGYVEMLRKAGNADRLVALATDARRHDRLLDLTGTDAASLATIWAARHVALDAAEPDLVIAARLAVHRARLMARNGSAPAELPGVWWSLGDRVRAETSLETIRDAANRARALAGMALAAAAAGDNRFAQNSRARALTAADTSTFHDFEALVALARMESRMGHRENASALLNWACQGDDLQTLRLATVVAAAFDVGQRDVADRILSQVNDPASSAGILVGLALIWIGAGEPARARKAARRAVAATESGALALQRFGVGGFTAYDLWAGRTAPEIWPASGMNRPSPRDIRAAAKWAYSLANFAAKPGSRTFDPGDLTVAGETELQRQMLRFVLERVQWVIERTRNVVAEVVTQVDAWAGPRRAARFAMDVPDALYMDFFQHRADDGSGHEYGLVAVAGALSSAGLNEAAVDVLSAVSRTDVRAAGWSRLARQAVDRSRPDAAEMAARAESLSRQTHDPDSQFPTEALLLEAAIHIDDPMRIRALLRLAEGASDSHAAHHRLLTFCNHLACLGPELAASAVRLIESALLRAEAQTQLAWLIAKNDSPAAADRLVAEARLTLAEVGDPAERDRIAATLEALARLGEGEASIGISSFAHLRGATGEPGMSAVPDRKKLAEALGGPRWAAALTEVAIARPAGVRAAIDEYLSLHST